MIVTVTAYPRDITADGWWEAEDTAASEFATLLGDENERGPHTYRREHPALPVSYLVAVDHAIEPRSVDLLVQMHCGLR